MSTQTFAPRKGFVVRCAVVTPCGGTPSCPTLPLLCRAHAIQLVLGPFGILASMERRSSQRGNHADRFNVFDVVVASMGPCLLERENPRTRSCAIPCAICFNGATLPGARKPGPTESRGTRRRRWGRALLRSAETALAFGTYVFVCELQWSRAFRFALRSEIVRRDDGILA